MSRPYINEVRYSHLEDLRCMAATLQYDIAPPGMSFEQQVQSALATARTYHLDDELGLALDGYQQLQALILKTVNPQLPIGASRHPAWQSFNSPELTSIMMSTTAAAVGRTPISLPDLPSTVINPDPVPAEVTTMLAPFIALGTTAGLSGDIGARVQQASVAAAKEDWTAAAVQYRIALKQAGPDQPALGAYLTHDLGVLTIRSGDLAGAGTLLQQAAAAFAKAGIPEGQVASLSAQADVLTRQGQADEAAKISSEAVSIAQRTGLGTLSVAPTRSVPSEGISELTGVPAVSRKQALAAAAAAAAPAAAGDSAPAVTLGASELLTLQYLDRSVKTTTLTLVTETAQPMIVSFAGDATASLTAFYTQLQTTSDLSLVQIQRYPVAVFAAYIPYVYFFVLPMSIGDCLASMGDYAGAEVSYLAALSYQFINSGFEVTKVWTRLAETYLAEADTAYRAAGEDSGAIASVASLYGRVVAADGTVPAASPLYAQPAFAAFTARAQAVLAAADPLALTDNPLVIRLVVQARLRQQQIATGLNFFGFATDYLPPFSFEVPADRRTLLRAARRDPGAERTSSSRARPRTKTSGCRQIDQQVELARAVE